MNTTERKRLERLATHLERGKLKHDKWDFGCWHKENCVSAGCALGEASYLWPKLLKRVNLVGSELYDIALRGGYHTYNEHAAARLFGITVEEAAALFISSVECGLPDHLNYLKPLSRRAGRQQVAANIRRFLAKAKQDTKAL